MNVLQAKELISLYQYAIFAQVREVFDSIEPEDGFGEIIIEFSEDEFNNDAYNNLFMALLKHSNFADIIQVLSHFQFATVMELDNRFLLFGRDSNYNLDFGIELTSAKVVLIDSAQDAYTYAAKGEKQFLEFLCKYLEYTILPVELRLQSHVRTLYRDYVIALVGGEEYSDYYNFIFMADDETNQVDFIKFPINYNAITKVSNVPFQEDKLNYRYLLLKS